MYSDVQCVKNIVNQPRRHHQTRIYLQREGRWSLWTEGWVEFNGSEELSLLMVSMSWTWAEF